MNLVNKNIEISVYGKDQWVLNINNERNLIINHWTKSLFDLLKRAESLKQAHFLFNQHFDVNLTFNNFQEILDKNFQGYGILKGDELKKKKKFKEYVKWKVQLFNPEIAHQLAKPFQFLFQPKLFWFLFSGLVLAGVFLIAFFMTNHGLDTPMNQVPLLFLIFTFAMLFHELGHIAACNQFNVKSGGMGFGFYFLFPVVYADITNIWSARKGKRIIANLAGIFMDLLYALVIFLCYLIFQKVLFLYAAVVLVIEALLELNPFIRSDGYWVLSDYTETPNLLHHANKNISILVIGIKAKKSLKIIFQRLSKPWTLWYGLFNYILIIWLTAYILINQYDGLIRFPIIVYEQILKVINLEFSKIIISVNWMLYLFIYYLVFQLISIGTKYIVSKINLRVN